MSAARRRHCWRIVAAGVGFTLRPSETTPQKTRAPPRFTIARDLRRRPRPRPKTVPVARYKVN